jgi:hypothetical protein
MVTKKGDSFFLPHTSSGFIEPVWSSIHAIRRQTLDAAEVDEEAPPVIDIYILNTVKIVYISLGRGSWSGHSRRIQKKIIRYVLLKKIFTNQFIHVIVM